MSATELLAGDSVLVLVGEAELGEVQRRLGRGL